MRYIVLFLGLCFFTACQKKGMNTVKVNGQYELQVPSFAEEVVHLSPNASLQYANPNNDFCLMVIDDSKEDFQEILYGANLQDEFPNTIDGITSYLQVAQKSMVGGGKIDYSAVKSLQINGQDARQYSIQATIEGEDLYYLYTIVDGDMYYYQILNWTYSDKKDQYQELFEQISQSFKEL